jgi:hypothetical protein
MSEARATAITWSDRRHRNENDCALKGRSRWHALNCDYLLDDA